ncbi:MAG TPA: HD domain-containing phosphohydrolase [Gallionella sp.]|nr:HD domain-containing phosphohydrolase [Gallionella sp.]
MPNIAEIAESQLDDPAYLKAITELGDSVPLVTTQNLNSSTGIKLVNAGTRFNSSLYNKLLQHKLVPTLDQSLAIEDAVSNNSLAAELPTILAEEGWLQPMLATMLNHEIFEQILTKLPLHPTAAFKLTVMRERHPGLFRRSICLTLICIYLGIRCQMDSNKLVQLATAALLHDIGMLHIDPALLAEGYTLNNAERRHLYAHPLTAWMILKKCTDYSPAVLDAVLQHHERLDGSGYPQGLAGNNISLNGQIIAVAEIITSRNGNMTSAFDKMRLEAMLKLNSRRYGRRLIGYLDVFYRSDEAVPACTDAYKQLIRNQLLCTQSAFSEWEKLWDAHYQGYATFDSINRRMLNLKMEVLDAGLAPLDIDESLDGIEDSPRACFEMHILLDEVIWQLQSVLDEIRRRWPDINGEGPASCAIHILNWINATEQNIKSNKLTNPAGKSRGK